MRLPGQVPRHAPEPSCGHRCGVGLDPEGICRVVCRVARPGVYPAAPSAPVPPRGGRRHITGVARGPRARAGVAAAPKNAGRFSRTLTEVCGQRAAIRRGYCYPPSPHPPPAPTPPTPLTARRQASPPSPGPRARPGVHCMHGRQICRVVGMAIERHPSRRPVSLKIGPQIKSNHPIHPNLTPRPNRPSRLPRDPSAHFY